MERARHRAAPAEQPRRAAAGHGVGNGHERQRPHIGEPAGGAAVDALTFTPGVVAGNITFDVRRLGAVNGPPLVSTYEGIPRNNTNGVVGAGWDALGDYLAADAIHRVRYEPNLDPPERIRAAGGRPTRELRVQLSRRTASVFRLVLLTLSTASGPPCLQTRARLRDPGGTRGTARRPPPIFPRLISASPT